MQNPLKVWVLVACLCFLSGCDEVKDWTKEKHYQFIPQHSTKSPLGLNLAKESSGRPDDLKDAIIADGGSIIGVLTQENDAESSIARIRKGSSNIKAQIQHISRIEGQFELSNLSKSILVLKDVKIVSATQLFLKAPMRSNCEVVNVVTGALKVGKGRYIVIDNRGINVTLDVLNKARKGGAVFEKGLELVNAEDDILELSKAQGLLDEKQVSTPPAAQSTKGTADQSDPSKATSQPQTPVDLQLPFPKVAANIGFQRLALADTKYDNQYVGCKTQYIKLERLLAGFVQVPIKKTFRFNDIGVIVAFHSFDSDKASGFVSIQPIDFQPIEKRGFIENLSYNDIGEALPIRAQEKITTITEAGGLLEKGNSNILEVANGRLGSISLPVKSGDLGDAVFVEFHNITKDMVYLGMSRVRFSIASYDDYRKYIETLKNNGN